MEPVKEVCGVLALVAFSASATRRRFAAGDVERIGVHRDRIGDCASLAASSFSPDSRGGKSSEWQRGYEDGQRLGWNLELLRRLKECFVPVPAEAE